jgi:hypothetical protein
MPTKPLRPLQSPEGDLNGIALFVQQEQEQEQPAAAVFQADRRRRRCGGSGMRRDRPVQGRVGRSG